RHGFTVAARTRGLRLPLADCPRPEVPPPAGVAITTLAERPELAPGTWEVACETFPDIPYGGDTPMQVGSYEQFAAGALSGPRYQTGSTFAARRSQRSVRERTFPCTGPADAPLARLTTTEPSPPGVHRDTLPPSQRV